MRGGSGFCEEVVQDDEFDGDRGLPVKFGRVGIGVGAESLAFGVGAQFPLTHHYARALLMKEGSDDRKLNQIRSIK